MQTNLAAEFRDSAAGREADAILRKCTHCGFCTATCPTYVLLGDELDSPRGRIYQVKQLLEGAERVYHVLGRDAGLDDRLAKAMDRMRLRSRQGVEPPSALVDPRQVLHEMRLFKEPAELELMRRAAAITAEAHHDAARLARAGRFEYELEAALEYAFRRLGGRGPAYGTIVGSGANATVLHYVENSKKLEGGELVLIDAGCELEGYASDVTRTYPVGGRFEGRDAILAYFKAAPSAPVRRFTVDRMRAAAIGGSRSRPAASRRSSRARSCESARHASSCSSISRRFIYRPRTTSGDWRRRRRWRLALARRLMTVPIGSSKDSAMV